MNLRSQLLNIKPYKCECCGNLGTWNNQPLTLQIHHIDGNHKNNSNENLMFLCPNCHSQTDSFCKNKGGSFNEQTFMDNIYAGKTIRQSLFACGLSDGSKNYAQAYKTLSKYQYDYEHSCIGHDGQINTCIDCGQIISNSAIRCPACNAKRNQVCERPTKEELLKEIQLNGFLAVGRKYGVSDNAIRKWCKAYDLPTTKKEIKDFKLE